MEYFVIQNLGFDGIIITKYSSKEEAEEEYKKQQDENKAWIAKYGEKMADKGLVLIEGNILKIQDMEI